ncbi:MAG: SEC-C domain-containing protein [Blastocatellales bacterium]|nr:SEC-C domain-containing protein [Nitrosomonas nitrosa]
MIDEVSRLSSSVRAMQDYFPAFSLDLRENGQKGAVWKGKVQPIQTAESLAELLDDIHCERPVWVLAGGEVRHHHLCNSTHTHHAWVDGLTNPFIVFDLEARYGGHKQHPKVFVRNPKMPLPKTKHTFGDGSICPYAPWENVWLWERDTAADYLGHACVWLIKWLVWDQTGIWVGPEMSHDKSFLSRTIGRNNQCWCGSGLKYKKCHLIQDQMK